MDLDLRWFVVVTKPSKEKLAKHGIEEQGFPVRMFMCTFERPHTRSIETVREPLFRRYLFAQFAISQKHNDRGKRWQGIGNTRGVRRLLGADTNRYSHPTPVPVGIVEDLEARQDAHGFIHLVPPEPVRFEKGEKVHFVDGPFLGIDALVQEDEDARVNVLLDIMGTGCVIPVMREQIARG
jgi:transcription antitermination factor NusG